MCRMNELISRENLKLCPFCGGEAELVTFYIKGVANRKNHFARCRQNHFCRTRNYRSRNDAIEAWNKRASQPPAEQWIPCDIARPTESDIYWATVEVYWCDEPVSIQLEYNHKKDEWIGGYDVIAWMPAILSEPYKGVE